MNRKQLLPLLVLFFVVCGIGLIVYRQNNAAWQGGGASTPGGKILAFPVNDVARITVKDAKSELNLVKKDDFWTVAERAGYPAGFDEVSRFVLKLQDLKPVQDVKVGPSQFGRLDLVEPGKGDHSGALVDLLDDKGKRLAALLAGKQYMRQAPGGMGEGGFPAGRYVMAEDGSNRVFLVSEPLEEINTKPERWLNHDFLKIENPKSIMLGNGSIPAQNWQLTRDSDSGPWKLADPKPGEEIDASKVSGMAGAFASASFTDVLAPDYNPASTGLDKPVTVTIETFDNFTYTLRIGRLTPDGNYPVLFAVSANLPKERTPAKDEKAEDKTKRDQEFQAKQKALADKSISEQKFTQRPYLIPKYTVEQVLKDRPQLLVEKKPEPTPAPASSPTPTVFPSAHPAATPSAATPAASPSASSARSSSPAPAHSPSAPPALPSTTGAPAAGSSPTASSSPSAAPSPSPITVVPVPSPAAPPASATPAAAFPVSTPAPSTPVTATPSASAPTPAATPTRDASSPASVAPPPVTLATPVPTPASPIATPAVPTTPSLPTPAATLLPSPTQLPPSATPTAPSQ